ncbi:hypothetical protein F5J12DRAFT_806243 [Pisolithus orientalis]|uniref:uncharacterized protein n=1 Tax=Pisolithus orientalis TaxID=936130 RepID=UPI0022249176|nr:uncharacterized protein F5J12DRAFT_806243 [Pisolithus orientalis]KAI6028567.1 hypothetical protein F5J12DRAFT_806243 [Pisolithus orientalis]
MARRLYLGRLPPDTRAEDVAKFFDGYGRIVDCRVMTGFGFVEFESSKDAEDAVHHFNGKSFMGANIVVEFAKEGRPRRDPYENDRNHGSVRSRRPPGVRLIVSGISRDTSWQDLKDFGREAGSVSFADIDRDLAGQGVLEYLSRDDADRAVKDLDGKDLRGRPVRVAYDESRGGADNYRRDDRRDDRYREERHYRDERSSYRRERSKSPPRRVEDDRRPRSPPPGRRDYDERKPAGYDDYRRGGYDDDRRAPDYYDRRRDDLDRRREERSRRDDKDDRYDDRSARHTNGDGGWVR